MAARVPAASLGKRLEALGLAPLLLIGALGVGWLAWCVYEWGNSRTPSYRLLGLRVVRTVDEQPAGVARSFVRSSICLLLVLPTTVICCVIGISFLVGASAPENLLRDPRTAPWDRLTGTKVVDERTQPTRGDASAREWLDHIPLGESPSAPEAHTNGRVH
jgi:RDD family